MVTSKAKQSKDKSIAWNFKQFARKRIIIFLFVFHSFCLFFFPLSFFKHESSIFLTLYSYSFILVYITFFSLFIRWDTEFFFENILWMGEIFVSVCSSKQSYPMYSIYAFVYMNLIPYSFDVEEFRTYEKYFFECRIPHSLENDFASCSGYQIWCTLSFLFNRCSVAISSGIILQSKFWFQYFILRPHFFIRIATDKS